MLEGLLVVTQLRLALGGWVVARDQALCPLLLLLLLVGTE